MSAPHVLVVGGGLAGISAALACADGGARVTLLEARTRLGGATWSTQQQGIWIDNGQHLFMRCFSAYRALLRRLGVEDRVELQDRLAVPVLAPGGRQAWIRRSGLPAPLHLASSLARYGHLSWRDRLGIARAARRLGRLDLNDPALDAQSFGDWLADNGQSRAAVERFWDLITRPTLNLPAAEASLALATRVFQTGLLEDADAGDIGYSRVPLQHLHGDPAAEALARAGVEVRLRSRIDTVVPPNLGELGVWCRAENIGAQALILATTHDDAARLLPAAAGVDTEALLRLGNSPIVNLHVVYNRAVTPLAFAAGIDSPVEYLFDRTRGAGLERGQYLAISLSAADAYVGLPLAELRKRFAREIERLLPGACGARIERFTATCERAATFRQAPNTRRLRPGTDTAIPGLQLAGAWTDTGWPATMEGAARSGLVAARAALRHVGLKSDVPAPIAA